MQQHMCNGLGSYCGKLSPVRSEIFDINARKTNNRNLHSLEYRIVMKLINIYFCQINRRVALDHTLHYLRKLFCNSCLYSLFSLFSFT